MASCPNISGACEDCLISVGAKTRIYGQVVGKDTRRSLMGKILVNAAHASVSIIGY